MGLGAPAFHFLRDSHLALAARQFTLRMQMHIWDAFVCVCVVFYNDFQSPLLRENIKTSPWGNGSE